MVKINCIAFIGKLEKMRLLFHKNKLMVEAITGSWSHPLPFASPSALPPINHPGRPEHQLTIGVTERKEFPIKQDKLIWVTSNEKWPNS